MRKITYISRLITGFGLIAIMTACDSLVSETLPDKSSPVYLEVEVEGIRNNSRALIEGTVLPDNSTYSICAMEGNSMQFIEGGRNVEVDYSGGKSVLSEDIVLPEGIDVPIYALYPFNKTFHPVETEIEILSQTDYLWGNSVDAEGNLAYVSSEQPKAKIQFDHILARITVRIHRSQGNSEEYDITRIALTGEGEGTYRRGWISLLNRNVNGNSSDYSVIDGALSGNLLADDKDIVTVDFLILPAKAQWNMLFFFSERSSFVYEMPVMQYESGKQYVFDCSVDTNNDDPVFAIEKCEIIPWKTNMMGEIIVNN